MQTDSLRSVNPSFNDYSSSGTGNLADIAARVVNEFRQENGSNGSVFGLEEYDYVPWDQFGEVNQSRSLITIPDVHREEEEGEEEEEEEEEESEFEFAFVATEPDSSPISADEIFYNGQIKPVYPLFDQSLLEKPISSTNDVDAKKKNNNVQETTRRTRRPQLRKLMVEEERETTTSSCSSSEADELDGLKQDERRKKCSSTGSSRRWKLRDILSRSRSVGKEGLLFAPSIKKLGSSKRTGKEESAAIAAENENLKNGAVSIENDEGEKIKNKDEERKRTTYKQDFVGFLANVNGLSRNLHPF
ncbi:hypothetical protein G4B88_022913 [Cannabis sativa]|uniref:Uncharacterized protein n=1 Tax=Cannabis sativa TaxID=3483 RepID=A0A7J6G7L0_CANSA|nr:hypothetical protein G4B88_022913 [Cannabis sativa]